MNKGQTKEAKQELSRLIARIQVLFTEKLQIHREQEKQIARLNLIDLEMEPLKQQAIALKRELGEEWVEKKPWMR